MSNLRVKLDTTTNKFLRFAAIVGAITVLAGGYTWYLNTLWKPKIEVEMVDFVNGIAKLKYNKKTFTLEGDSTYLLDADWGVRFGTIKQNNQTIYNRIELLKKGMVVENLKR
jgi:hypothetical protein